MALELIGGGGSYVPSKVSHGSSELFEEIIAPGTYPSYSVTREATVCTRAFRVKHDRLNVFGNECMPSSSFYPGRHPGMAGTYVDTVEVNPFASDGAIKYYQNSDGYTVPEDFLCIVKYGPFVPEISAGAGNSGNSGGADLYEGNVNVSTEVMMVDGAGFNWAGGTTRIKEHMQVPIVIPVTDREIKQQRVLTIPWATIRSLSGSVNNATYAGVAAEGLLYLGASIGFKFAFDGTMTYSLAHKFKERSFNAPGGTLVGWNHYYRKETKTWVKTDPLTYKAASFSGLLPNVS